MSVYDYPVPTTPWLNTAPGLFIDDYTSTASSTVSSLSRTLIYDYEQNPDSGNNVVALAAGIADGLGYGDNTKAALITRGITEIARLGIKMGGHFETFCGLSGIGDLIVTCASMHSRNRRAGILIGKGYTMEEAMDEVKMVVEGVYSAKAAMTLAEKYEVQLPIIEQVNEVLFHGKAAAQAVNDLMLRDKKIEISDDTMWS